MFVAPHLFGKFQKVSRLHRSKSVRRFQIVAVKGFAGVHGADFLKDDFANIK